MARTIPTSVTIELKHVAILIGLIGGLWTLFELHGELDNRLIAIETSLGFITENIKDIKSGSNSSKRLK